MVLLVCALSAARSSAQLPEFIAMGYIGLSVGSTVRLVEGDCCEIARIGSEVRGSFDDNGRATAFAGRVVSIDSVFLAIANDSTTRRIARHDVRRAYVNAGRQHQWAQGWVEGLFGFGILGAVLGYASGPPDPNSDSFVLTRTEKAAIGGVAFGVVGSALGAGLGALVTKVHWKRVGSWENGGS